jgi:thymidylate synthase (FAD)
MDAQRWYDVQLLPTNQLMDELAYMANTIPSSWEFVTYTFAVEGVTRACTHQMVRTRTASFAQQSMRVTDMSQFKTLMPPKYLEGEDRSLASCYDHTMEGLRQAYRTLIENGSAEEDARGVLPTNILTNIVCHYNLRTLSDLVKSRSGGRTQDEYREVVKKFGELVLKIHPWTDQFLYPKGRDYFKDLEEAVHAKIPMRESRNEVLKIIDKMRKNQ